jgi:hypothetical protein
MTIGENIDKKELLKPGKVHIKEALSILEKKENVLEEALSITSTDRRSQYGHPKVDFERTAKITSVLLDKEITAKEIVIMLIAMKLSRNAYQYKRDTCVDIAGYARVLSILNGDEG